MSSFGVDIIDADTIELLLSVASWNIYLSLGIAICGSIVTIIVHMNREHIISGAALLLSIDDNERVESLFEWPLVVTIALSTLWGTIQPLSLPTSISSFSTSLFITLVVLFWVQSLLRLGYAVIEGYVSQQLDADLVPIVENIWTFFVLISTIVIILNAWNIDVTPLLASAGVLGVVIGLAARDTVANFFGSLALYADNTYQTGDYIVLNDGIEGYVHDISIRSTVLRTLDGDQVTIPNSKLNNATIRNKSSPRPDHRIELSVGVSYESNPDQVKELLESMLEDEDIITNEPEPQVFLREFGDSAIVYDILIWISEPRKRRKVADKLNRNLYEDLSKEGVEFPFPQRSIHFKDHSNVKNIDVGNMGEQD